MTITFRRFFGFGAGTECTSVRIRRTGGRWRVYGPGEAASFGSFARAVRYALDRVRVWYGGGWWIEAMAGEPVDHEHVVSMIPERRGPLWDTTVTP